MSLLPNLQELCEKNDLDHQQITIDITTTENTRRCGTNLIVQILGSSKRMFFFLHFGHVFGFLFPCFFASSLLCSCTVLPLCFSAFCSLHICFFPSLKPSHQNLANSTKMFQNLWTMKGSYSEILQRQLKWQLPALKCCK